MEQVSYCLFDTPLGLCGIAWRGCGDSQAPPAVTRFQFPEATTAKAEARIARKSGAPRRPRRRGEWSRSSRRCASTSGAKSRTFGTWTLIWKGRRRSRGGCTRPRDRSRRERPGPTGSLPGRWGGPARPGPSDGRWGATRSDSSSRAIGSWPSAARPADSPPTEDGRQRQSCWRSKGRCVEAAARRCRSRNKDATAREAAGETDERGAVCSLICGRIRRQAPEKSEGRGTSPGPHRRLWFPCGRIRSRSRPCRRRS